MEKFCNKENSHSQHNQQAPNLQNRLCDLKSSWEIITQSNDFANGANPPLQNQDTIPTFKVLKVSSPRSQVLVLDTSNYLFQVHANIEMREGIFCTFGRANVKNDEIMFISLLTIESRNFALPWNH